MPLAHVEIYFCSLPNLMRFIEYNMTKPHDSNRMQKLLTKLSHELIDGGANRNLATSFLYEIASFG